MYISKHATETQTGATKGRPRDLYQSRREQRRSRAASHDPTRPLLINPGPPLCLSHDSCGSTGGRPTASVLSYPKAAPSSATCRSRPIIEPKMYRATSSGPGGRHTEGGAPVDELLGSGDDDGARAGDGEGACRVLLYPCLERHARVNRAWAYHTSIMCMFLVFGITRG